MPITKAVGVEFIVESIVIVVVSRALSFHVEGKSLVIPSGGPYVVIFQLYAV